MSKLIKPNFKLVKQFVRGKTLEEIVGYNFRNERESAIFTSGIIGFKEYKIDSSKFDCDRTELTMSIWCLLLENGQNVREVLGYEGRKISYINKVGDLEHVETDTINSIETDLNIFIRKLLNSKFKKSWFDLYTHDYRIENGGLVPGIKKQMLSSNDRDLWFIANYDEIINEEILTSVETEILQALIDWSNYIHTIGNFMIGPVGFNFKSSVPKAKSKCGKDQIDLFLENVKSDSTYTIWQKELSSYNDINMIDVYFEGNKLTDWNEVAVKELRTGELAHWINNIVFLIQERGEMLAARLLTIINR
ncbi:hypothetical protein [Paenibacillus planticolens]|uniref:Uncharacterized protein n=1 Tax=Paenibacillus planticolens TaxID=2654976 RepID=A0ABX1ZJ84_9BACL|nr:hypothetical protein [Paenibacillus planticolens]NOU99497.1 hypothetical protein [Paenibacillus planticolens]